MYYITYSEEYPIYEPAEGGYYYTGSSNVWSAKFSTYRKARQRMKKLLKEMRSEVNVVSYNNRYFGYNGKYIGDGWLVELTKDKLPSEHGYEPYC